MRFDLHIHSRCSDGHDRVSSIIDAAAKKGLGGLSITDHDSLRGSETAKKIIREQKLDLVLIPGAEVTTTAGHLLVLGIEDLPQKERSIEETTETVHEQGGITIVPHPYHPFRHSIGRIPDCDAVEVFNSKHLFGLANARARIGAMQHHLPMVAGSDSHFADTVGLGITDIEAENTEDAIEAIRSGRTRIIGKRTHPKFFISNTFQSIRLEIVKGVQKLERTNGK